MTNDELLAWLTETEKRIRQHIADFTADLSALHVMRGLIEQKQIPTEVGARVMEKFDAPKEDTSKTKIWRPAAEELMKAQAGEFTSGWLIEGLRIKFPAADIGELKVFVLNFLNALVKFGSVKKDGTRKNYRYTLIQFTSRGMQAMTVAETPSFPPEPEPEGELFCEECGGQSGVHKMGCRVEDAPPMIETEVGTDDLTRREGESVADFYARKRGMFLVKPKTQ